MRVAVCAPTFGRGEEFEHPTPIHEVAKILGGWTPFTGGTSPHDRSRGLIQARAMQTEADAFLWIDDDIKASVEQCVALRDVLQQLDAMGTGVMTVSGIYICRHLIQSGQVAFNFALLPDTKYNFGPAVGKPHLTVSHAMGFCIITRACLEWLDAPECDYEGLSAKAWWLPQVVERQHLGEDRSFTYRVASQHQNLDRDGWPLWVDTRLTVEHAGYKL